MVNTVFKYLSTVSHLILLNELRSAGVVVGGVVVEAEETIKHRDTLHRL